MNEDFLVSKRTGTSSSWTLTTRLGQMLQEAEKRYGRRDREFTLLGIESPRVLIQYTGPSHPHRESGTKDRIVHQRSQ